MKLVFNVGDWLAHGDYAMDVDVDLVAAVEHRPIPVLDFVGNLAQEVVGKNWSSEVVFLFLERLGGRAGGIKLPLVYGPFMP